MQKPVATVEKDTLITQAATIMAERKLGFLVVVDAKTGLDVQGVVSDSDLIARVIAPRLNPGQVIVQDIMSMKVISIRSDATISDAANIMKANHIKRLPVIDDGRLIGIISSTDIMHSIVDIKKTLLDVALEF